MSGPIVYNFGGIAASAGELDSAVGQTLALLEEGRSSLTRLAGEWEGEASMSWQEAQNRWDTNAFELNQALQSLSAAVRDGGEYMMLTNRSIGQSFTA